MNILFRVVLLVLCFFAAIACYVFGVPAGGVAFIVLGLIFEGMFWMSLFSKKKKVSKQSTEI